MDAHRVSSDAGDRPHPIRLIVFRWANRGARCEGGRVRWPLLAAVVLVGSILVLVTGTAPIPALVPPAEASPTSPVAYVANYGSNNVTPIATATNTAGSAITVGTYPAAIAVTPGGRTAYVA